MIYASNTRFYSRAAPPAPRTPKLGRVMAADVHLAAGARPNSTTKGCKTLAARSFGQPDMGSPLQQQRGGVGRRTCPRRSTGLSPTWRYAEQCKPKRCRELERPLQFLASSEKGLRLPRGNTRGVIPALQTASHTQRGLSQPINWNTAVQGPPEKPSPSPEHRGAAQMVGSPHTSRRAGGTSRSVHTQWDKGPSPRVLLGGSLLSSDFFGLFSATFTGFCLWP